jgi:putative nucleotidyltransferase with HDIG domain
MQSRDLDIFKAWFDGYSRTFYTDAAEDNKNIGLKIRHTSFVCENAVLIAREEQMADNDVLIAETAALFHDVGRFAQYAAYKTFRDSVSVNHGRLGAEILKEKEILADILPRDQELIINTVRFHNTFDIPSFDDKQKILFLRLIRDADKLDIWRVFAEHFHGAEEDKASAVGLGLPDRPDYSQTVLSCLHKKTPASLSDLKTLNDFKLMQLSWAYDLNFRPSFRLLAKRNLIREIASTLPQTTEISDALAVVEEFVNEKSGLKRVDELHA